MSNIVGEVRVNLYSCVTLGSKFLFCSLRIKWEEQTLINRSDAHVAKAALTLGKQKEMGQDITRSH